MKTAVRYQLRTQGRSPLQILPPTPSTFEGATGDLSSSVQTVRLEEDPPSRGASPATRGIVWTGGGTVAHCGAWRAWATVTSKFLHTVGETSLPNPSPRNVADEITSMRFFLANVESKPTFCTCLAHVNRSTNKHRFTNRQACISCFPGSPQLHTS